jgi:hypothetical protein
MPADCQLWYMGNRCGTTEHASFRAVVGRPRTCRKWPVCVKSAKRVWVRCGGHVWGIWSEDSGLAVVPAAPASTSAAGEYVASRPHAFYPTHTPNEGRHSPAATSH